MGKTARARVWATLESICRKAFRSLRESVASRAAVKVLVLGAGASKAYADSKSGLRMPLARDFLVTS
jgi:hypothetical protein